MALHDILPKIKAINDLDRRLADNEDDMELCDAGSSGRSKRGASVPRVPPVLPNTGRPPAKKVKGRKRGNDSDDDDNGDKGRDTGTQVDTYEALRDDIGAVLTELRKLSEKVDKYHEAVNKQVKLHENLSLRVKNLEEARVQGHSARAVSTYNPAPCTPGTSSTARPRKPLPQ